MRNKATIFLVKFFIPTTRDDLIPRGFDLIEEMPDTTRHFTKLRRLGFAALAEVGRWRPGKRDSGDEIASPQMASAPLFLESMKKQGLAIIQAERFYDDGAKRFHKKDGKKVPANPRFVVSLSVGFAAEDVKFKPSDRKAIENLFQNTWLQCHVWDNERPRQAGMDSVDTINFTGCADDGTPAIYSLVIKDGTENIELDWSPFNPTAKPLTVRSGETANA